MALAALSLLWGILMLLWTCAAASRPCTWGLCQLPASSLLLKKFGRSVGEGRCNNPITNYTETETIWAHLRITWGRLAFWNHQHCTLSISLEITQDQTKWTNYGHMFSSAELKVTKWELVTRILKSGGQNISAALCFAAAAASFVATAFSLPLK